MTRGALIPKTVTLHVPFRIVKRGGRKEMQMPEGATQPRRTDCTLLKALARAFRWERMLESGEFASISELAEREGIAFTYMARLMRLSLLSPLIVEANLEVLPRPRAGSGLQLRPAVDRAGPAGGHPSAPRSADVASRRRSRRCRRAECALRLREPVVWWPCWPAGHQARGGDRAGSIGGTLPQSCRDAGSPSPWPPEEQGADGPGADPKAP